MRKRFIALLCLAVLISIGLVVFKNTLFPRPNARFYPAALTAQPTPWPPYTPPTPQPLPDFSKETLKPRTQFDLGKWREFEDARVGVRFRYPPEWGEPEAVYNTSGSCGPNTSHPGTTCPDSGTLFWVGFPNSQFEAGGVSRDFGAGRGAHFTDFGGLNSSSFWKTANSLCGVAGDLFCTTAGKGIHSLSSLRCPTEQAVGSFYHLFFIDRPSKTISGLVFGGRFFSDKIDLQTLADSCKDKTVKYELEQAILQRKLDAESMRNFDAYEKVFETVEVF